MSQPGAGQPDLCAGFAHGAVDGDLFRLQQVTQGTDECDVKHIAVAKPGEFGKMIDNAGHGLVRGSEPVNDSGAPERVPWRVSIEAEPGHKQS
jgi:hypothetical protein